MTRPDIDYHTAGPVLDAFHASDARVRMLIGPFGSGKSVACAMELMRRAINQPAGKGGVRRSRFCVVRNTYSQLRDTTLATWRAWFGQMGKLQATPPYRHRIRLDPGDGTKVETEILFYALDRPEDARKLLSLELTGAWINEAREVPVAVIRTLLGRIDRYPAQRDGGAGWAGVIADTNPPDDDHWLYRLAEVERPEGWEVFRQPGGLIRNESGGWSENLAAENLENLPSHYYERQVPGNASDWVAVHLAGEYGFVRGTDRPVFIDFYDRAHVAPLAFDPALPLHIGIDFGLTPAAVLAQLTTPGQVCILDELVTEDMSIAAFADALRVKLGRDWACARIDGVTGDPAGGQRAQTDARTPFDMMRAAGFPAKPAQTNDFEIRREAVAKPLRTLDGGRPQLMIDPRCVTLRKGMAGRYRFRRVAASGGEGMYRDKPVKDRTSHVCEALQYLMLGLGFGRRVIEIAPGLRAGEARSALPFDPLEDY
ncbi:MAG: phage terminase large subunit [Pseudomonadota bacterium]|nr:phage terminase large subunit [Pseudomonadota bacterium]